MKKDKIIDSEDQGINLDLQQEEFAAKSLLEDMRGASYYDQARALIVAGLGRLFHRWPSDVGNLTQATENKMPGGRVEK